MVVQRHIYHSIHITTLLQFSFDEELSFFVQEENFYKKINEDDIIFFSPKFKLNNSEHYTICFLFKTANASISFNFSYYVKTVLL